MKTSKAIILAGEMQFTERNCRKEKKKKIQALSDSNDSNAHPPDT